MATIVYPANNLSISNFAVRNGNNVFNGDQTINGSLFISNDLEISGRTIFKVGQVSKTNIQTSNYEISYETDYYVSFSGSNLTATLPPPNVCEGSMFVVKNKHTSKLHITSSNGYIDGKISAELDVRYNSYTFISDGIEWNII